MLGDFLRPARGVACCALLASTAACHHRVTLPPAEAVRASQSLERGQSVVVDEDGEPSRISHYDDVLIESQPICDAPPRSCDEDARFSENCVEPPPPKCERRVDRYYTPVELTLTDEELVASDGDRHMAYSRERVTRVTLRDKAPNRGLLVVGTALLVGVGVTTGLYLYVQHEREQEKDGEGGMAVPGIILPFIGGAAAGIGSIAITLPLTSRMGEPVPGGAPAPDAGAKGVAGISLRSRF